jgi:protein involved in polysaccharide export with SLBB domain
LLPKPAAPAPAATTANTTTGAAPGPSEAMAAPTAEAAANGTAIPGASNNLSPALGSSAQPPASGPNLANFALPATMENIDDQHHLVPGDQIVVKIAEDRDSPKLLFVDEKGAVMAPWINQPILVQGLTLRDAAVKIKAALADPDLGYYQPGHPTVLAAYYRNDNSRGQAFVDGAVQRPGWVTIPKNNILTLSDAILAAGNWAPSADKQHVIIFHHDVSDPSKEPRETVNVADLMSKGIIASNPILPGDIVSVQSIVDTGASYMITGDGVSRQGRFPLPTSGPPMTVSNAVLQAGYDPRFSKLSAVRLIHYTVDPKTGKSTSKETTVDVESILKNGTRSDDPVVENGDWIIVDQKFFAF